MTMKGMIDVKNLWKRNQIMITALALMIVIAGYLNFTEKEIEDEIEDDVMVTNSAQFEEASTDEAVTDVALQESDLLDGIYDISDEDISTYSEIESLDSEPTKEGADYLDALDGTEQSSADMLYVTDEITTQAEATQSGDGEQNTETEQNSPTGQDAQPESAQVTDTLDGTESAENTMVDDIPGEAVFTSTTGVSSLESANLLKEQTRAKNKETLLEIINSETVSDEAKQQAITSMIELTDIAERECATEILLEAKGFADVVVSISGEMVDVMVGMSELSDAQRAQIEDIVKRKTGVSPENIIISPIVEN